MSLAEDLHRVLEHFRIHHLPTLTNQGAQHDVDEHLARLAAVAGDVEAGTAEAHRVLGELYGAPKTAAETPAPAAAPAPHDATPTASAPVVVGEPGPELAVLPQGEHVEPVQEPAEVEHDETPAPVDEHGPEAA